MAKVMVIGGLADSLVGFRGQLLRDMVRMGHEVTACAPEPSTSIAGKLADMGVAYHPIPINRTGLNPLQDLYSLWACTSFFRRMRPDVVLSYTIKPTIYGSLGASFARVNTISSMITGLGSSFSAGASAGRPLRFIASSLYRYGLRRNRVVFFQNPDDMQLFLQRGLVDAANRPTLINGSGVDLAHYDVRPLPDTTSFLLVARLIREKGIGEYAAAARIIKRHYPTAVFKLVGRLDTGPRGIPAGDLKSWQSDGVIDYLGRLDDVRPAIAGASVYVLPSFYGEGVPRSILEAMSMGRPVITTDTPGCRETVRPGVNGFLVPVRDATALAEAMARFLANPALAQAMGTASRKLAEEKFDVFDVNRIILKQLELWHETSV